MYFFSRNNFIRNISTKTKTWHGEKYLRGKYIEKGSLRQRYADKRKKVIENNDLDKYEKQRKTTKLQSTRVRGWYYIVHNLFACNMCNLLASYFKEN